MSKSLIRLTSNTSPFNRVESGILEHIFTLFNGDIHKAGLPILIRSNIKTTYSLNNSELMYFYSLYKKNWLVSGDFSSIQDVEVPKMYDFNVNYLQDVSAYNSINHNVIAADDFDADEAMEYDFGYGTEEVSSYVDDELTVGDYMDVFDREITHNLSKPINETVKIIKNILNEYKKYKK
jgi:hypothetical protein